ncbi:MAG: hypothetical protein GF334_11475 [Candidatus Altiarchaeales archaeon]|nr:hypothetical protein [Candidatus Altiarchaeales archaeon]
MPKEIPSVSPLEERITRVVTMRDMASSDVDRLGKEVLELEEEIKTLDMVSELFRTLIDKEIQQAVGTLKRLQTKGLGVVFDDQDVAVEADVSVKRGKVSVDLATCEDGSSGDVLEDYGGSIATLQSILLRLMVIRRRGLRSCLFLDESISAVNANYARNMSKFFKTLCSKLDLDMMVITHNESLTEHADKVYRVKKGVKGVSFEEVRKK